MAFIDEIKTKITNIETVIQDSLTINGENFESYVENKLDSKEKQISDFFTNNYSGKVTLENDNVINKELISDFLRNDSKELDKFQKEYAKIEDEMKKDRQSTFTISRRKIEIQEEELAKLNEEVIEFEKNFKAEIEKLEAQKKVLEKEQAKELAEFLNIIDEDDKEDALGSLYSLKEKIAELDKGIEELTNSEAEFKAQIIKLQDNIKKQKDFLTKTFGEVGMDFNETAKGPSNTNVDNNSQNGYNQNGSNGSNGSNKGDGSEHKEPTPAKQNEKTSNKSGSDVIDKLFGNSDKAKEETSTSSQGNDFGNAEDLPLPSGIEILEKFAGQSTNRDLFYKNPQSFRMLECAFSSVDAKTIPFRLKFLLGRAIKNDMKEEMNNSEGKNIMELDEFKTIIGISGYVLNDEKIEEMHSIMMDKKNGKLLKSANSMSKEELSMIENTMKSFYSGVESGAITDLDEIAKFEDKYVKYVKMGIVKAGVKKASSINPIAPLLNPYFKKPKCEGLSNTIIKGSYLIDSKFSPEPTTTNQANTIKDNLKQYVSPDPTYTQTTSQTPPTQTPPII